VLNLILFTAETPFAEPVTELLMTASRLSLSLARFFDGPVRGVLLISAEGRGLVFFFGFGARGGTAGGEEGFEPNLSLSFGRLEPGEETA
jgi:hypothetical protein